MKRSRQSAFDAYSGIETAKDLQREKLTLTEYNEVYTILTSIKHGGTSETIMQGVCDFFTRYGAIVKPKDIGWIISAP